VDPRIVSMTLPIMSNRFPVYVFCRFRTEVASTLERSKPCGAARDSRRSILLSETGEWERVMPHAAANPD